MKTLKKIGDAVNTGDDKGVIIAVALALIIISAVVAGYYIYAHPTPEGYTSISVLDDQGKAANYPLTLQVNQGTTYHVTVVNHMGASASCQVQEKITNETIQLLPVSISPANTFTKTLADGENWEIQAPVTLTQTGAYSIIFELWLDNAGTLKFTENGLVLNVDVVQS